MMMIIDLSEYHIVHVAQDSGALPDDARPRITLHLTKDKWVVLLIVESPEVNVNYLTGAHFGSKILIRAKLNSDKDIWILPLST